MSNPNETVRLYNPGGKVRSMPRAQADLFLAKNEGWRLVEAVEAPVSVPEAVDDEPATSVPEEPVIASSEPEEAVAEEAPVAKPTKKAKKRSASKKK